MSPKGHGHFSPHAAWRCKMCVLKKLVLFLNFFIQLFTIPFPCTLASLAFLCLIKLPELKAKIAGWKKKVTNNTWSSFYLSWFHLTVWLRKKDKIIFYNAMLGHTLLMRRFWGFRSLWSTLQLWQKARPFKSWYMNDWENIKKKNK